MQCLLNALLMRRRSGNTLPVQDLLDLGKSVLAALSMGGVLLLILPLLPGGRIAVTLLAVLIGALLYAGVTLLLRSEEARFAVRLIRRK